MSTNGNIRMWLFRGKHIPTPEKLFRDALQNTLLMSPNEKHLLLQGTSNSTHPRSLLAKDIIRMHLHFCLSLSLIPVSLAVSSISTIDSVMKLDMFLS